MEQTVARQYQKGDLTLARMDEHTLKSVVSQAIMEASDANAELARDRETAEGYYRGDLFGNEVDGESKAISRDVGETVDELLPELLETFSSGPIVQFEPNDEMGEAAAEQATEYVNYIWNTKNDGFGNLYAWTKDGLLKKRGIIKIWPEDEEYRHTEYFANVTPDEMALFDSMQDIEYERQEDGFVKVTRRRTRKCIRIMPVPHDEFLIDAQATSDWDARFVAHRQVKTVSDLISQGFDEDAVERAAGEAPMNIERDARFAAAGYGNPGIDPNDPAMRPVMLTECYMLIDYDGDGIAERRRIVALGHENVTEIVENEEVDDHPFATWCPYPMPHKFWGESAYDKVKDIQEIKSALYRGTLNSVYLANNPKTLVVDGNINMDDLLTAGNQVVRANTPDAARPMLTAPIPPAAFDMMQIMSNARDRRAGVSGLSSAPGSGAVQNAYTQTAYGANIIDARASARSSLVARLFAETGIKRAMKMIMKLVVKYDNEPRKVRLNGVWTQIEPRKWSGEMDMTVSAGLGSGRARSDAALMLQMLELDQKLIALQGGVDGPWVTTDGVYKKLSRLVTASGLKFPGAFYNDPKINPPQPKQPPPDPQMMAVMAQIEVEKEKLQLGAAELAQKQQAEQMKIGADLKKAEIQSETQIKTALIRSDADISLQDGKLRHEIGVKAAEGGDIGVYEGLLRDSGDIGALKEAFGQLAAALQNHMAYMQAPRRVLRDMTGQIAGVEVMGFGQKTVGRDENGAIETLQ